MSSAISSNFFLKLIFVHCETAEVQKPDRPLIHLNDIVKSLWT